MSWCWMRQTDFLTWALKQGTRVWLPGSGWAWWTAQRGWHRLTARSHCCHSHSLSNLRCSTPHVLSHTLIPVLLFFTTILCIVLKCEIESHSVAQPGFELRILLPLSPACQQYRCGYYAWLVLVFDVTFLFTVSLICCLINMFFGHDSHM